MYVGLYDSAFGIPFLDQYSKVESALELTITIFVLCDRLEPCLHDGERYSQTVKMPL